MSIQCFVLQHPQSTRDIDYTKAFTGPVKALRISCGTTQVEGSDLSEAADFWPTFASWNSLLFETSVILTTWMHADRLIGSDHVAFLHTDVSHNKRHRDWWEEIHGYLDEDLGRAVGLTAPGVFQGVWQERKIPDHVPLSLHTDPMWLHQFDHGVGVWDYLKKYDPTLFEWAMDTKPRIVYAHQFALSRPAFDALGSHLHRIVHTMNLRDTGLWTPHMFERLIGLFLVKHGGPAVHTTAFWHQQSSGRPVTGGHSLYGPRPFRYYLPEGRQTQA